MIQVKPIANSDAGVIRALADAFAAEWPAWAATITREALEDTFRCGEAGGLPVVFAALDAGHPVGTVALRPWFGDEPMGETPWVRGLWVAASHRGRGIDRRLMRSVADEARRRGFGRLYAGTTSIERLGARWGWRVFHRLEHRGEPMAWLYRELEGE